MKKIVTVIILGIVIGAISFFLTEKPTVLPKGLVQGEKISATSEATPSLSPNLVPETLIISSLGISAPIESVGMDQKGNMDVPKNPDNVAWYNLGFKPGEKGSAVIAGHFDKESGAPAVFYNVSKLKKGDIIKVTATDGTIFSYNVTDMEMYDFDKLPLTEIFSSTDKARLNLITCDGVFNQTNKNYSKRLVVYSEIVD